MSGGFEAELARELGELERQGRRRDLPADGHGPRADFCSNDTLGLARDPRVVAAAAEALARHGLGGRAARLLGGGGGHAELEREAAAWQRTEAALFFPSGYQANLGVVTALAGPGDAILSDALVHASLIDAARLSRARVLVHRHLDLADLEAGLVEARGARRRLVLTEGVFGMDGDRPDLAATADLCARHDAVLVVDEAHAAGLLGPEGAGAWPDAGATGAATVRVVTGGKALGAAGGLVVGSRVLCALLANRARSFVFTTAAPPAVAAGLRAAIGIVRSDAGLRARPRALAERLALALDLREPAAAIVPFVVGGEDEAMAAAASLGARFDVRAVRPPTVPAGTSRLRLVCHAHNTEAEVDALAAALVPLRRPVPPALARREPRRGAPLFVAGTDTGVGKTVVAAVLLRAALRAGLPARYWKPVQSGPDSDTATVRRLAGAAPTALATPAFELPLPASPDQAAAAAGVAIRLDDLAGRLAELRAAAAPLVVELAGGLCVPYGDGTLQLDWLARGPHRLVLVARSGLGTLNHGLLSLEALRRRGLEPEALILVGPPHPANRASLARCAPGLRLVELPHLDPLDPASLDAWLERHDLSWAWPATATTT